jgi:hypothetical protein
MKIQPSIALTAASRLGLDPRTNRFHCPLVYHEGYSFADWPSTHTFPVRDKAKAANNHDAY